MKSYISFLLTAVVLFAAFTGTGFAYTLNDHGRAACTASGITWNSSPLFYINTTSGDFSTSAQQLAIIEPLDRIGQVAGAWIDPAAALINESSSMPNLRSEIYLGVFDHPGVTLIDLGTGSNECTIEEADIKMNQDDDFIYGVPSTFYDPDASADGGDYYFRGILLHEMGHAMGLDHEDDAFSIMNYWYQSTGGPFTNRVDAKMIEPLPDDRQGLRAQYPATGTERDLAILNYWVDTDTVSSTGAAYQRKLCKPSRGTAWTDVFEAEYCGVNPNTTVCPGNDLRIRFAIANYGTSAEVAEVEMWLSTDENFNYFTDIKSPTSHSYTLSSGTSHLAAAKWEIPSGVTAFTYYYVIMRAKLLVNPGEDSAQNNWMILRSQVFVPFGC